MKACATTKKRSESRRGKGAGALIRVVAGTDLDEAFGPPELIGHHANWAARAYGTAVRDVRNGRSSTDSIAEAERHLRHTPYLTPLPAHDDCRAGCR